MPSNQGFTLSYKGQNGYIPLYPNTTTDQVIDWDLGNYYGPIQITLLASNWSNNQQTIAVNGVTSNDILNCVKVLSGTEAEMEAQDEAYSLLDPYVGIESLENGIRFTCTSSSPTVDLTVQIDWAT